MKRNIILLLTFLISIKGFSQNQSKIDNLKTFAKAYGYVKYFHPSDEAAHIDWGNFSIYGAKQIERCSTQGEVISTLNQLFKPIAPSIVFSSSKQNFDYNSITPSNLKKYKATYWQHKGVSLGMQYQNSIYKSIRVNKETESDQATSSFGNILTSINPEKYRGKEIKYTAWVKLKKESKGSGHLWLRVDKDGFFENMDRNPIKSNEWNKYEIVGNIDSLATNVVLGCFLKGKGKLYFDDAHLYYKENNEWIEIPITNNGFEIEPIGTANKQAKWTGKGNGYSFKTYNYEYKEGKKSALISYVGVIKKEKGEPIFDAAPKATDLIEEEIGNGIFCQIPLSLYFNKENTYPTAETSSLSELKKRIENSSINPNNLSVRLGNIINVYNVFQHFYPYFDVINVNWEKELKTALKRCFTDKTDNQHLITLQKFTAPLKDGHIWISGGSLGTYVPPISWEWIENKLVITKVWKDNIGINIGDVVTKVNNQAAEEYFAEINSRISAGTKGWLNYRSKSISLIGEHNENMSLEINGITHQLLHDFNILNNRSKSKSNKKTVSYNIINDSIFYLNLDLIEMDTINKLLPQLEKSKAIICDLRGYPNGNHNFICHLLKTDDTTDAWMQIPQFIYPNQKNIVGFEKHNWELKAKKPYLGNKNVVFITNGSAISYAESYMGYIEGYKLATIIGQPTAGTNGNTNPFNLPGGYRLNWTGMKVLKHDYSQHHAIGVLPNIYINKTVEGVKLEEDEFLEKAIQIIQE